ncbi:MAG: type I glutamate--ammonia ligase [Rickettsiales bacterium]|nr:type I glutamate--ammonia ligase [Rickettsiales bacterium]
MSNAENALKFIKENNIEFIDFRFTDTKGKWQHTAYHSSEISADTFVEGVMFDGSSIAGWKEINQSDMILMPDANTISLDPFAAQPTAILFCDVIEPNTGQGYERDPRSTAKRAEEYLKFTKLGDTAYFGPELEFFVFDNARFDVSSHGNFYSLDSEELPTNFGTEYPNGNMGHRPRVKGGYFPVQPVDHLNDIRAEMVSVLRQFGVNSVIHHHEVAPAQCELGITFGTLIEMADAVQKYKYVVHNVAQSYGKTATFMPKPVKGDNGSGMHTHQSIWNNGKPLFAGNGYADLSETALYYIGGIIKHAKALNAFTNASTNSYKRLIPGFEAPVLLAYSARNRSASIRIPYSASPKGKRIEVRFPDPTANPYFSFAAMLMAGIDGIQNKIHPGEAMDKNLYDLPPEELKNVPTVCGSLREALEALSKDREFLKKGGVFTDDLIDGYIELKMKEIYDMEHTPHPVEFLNYYSV